MKRLVATLVTVVSLFGLSGVANAATWAATLHKLPSTLNTRTFNVQYSVLSTQTDSFKATLLQSTDNESYTQCGPSQDTNADPNDINGGSGTLPACVVADDTYYFKVVLSRDNAEGDTRTLGPTSTKIDTVAPGAPIYGGKTQSGNNYVVTFTAPNTADVTHVRIYASTSTTYTADENVQIGDVAVAPNQTVNFNYSAPNSNTRYFSVQAFDAAGNGSTLVGDPGTVVTPVVFVNGAVAAAQTAAATAPAAAAGQVLGATTNTTNAANGQVNAPGSSSTKKNGKVLGSETNTSNTNSHNSWYYGVGAVILIALALYYWLFGRAKKPTI